MTSKKRYILALDQGTTCSRAILFNHEGKLCNRVHEEFKQHYPQPGWVEHDANDLWSTQKSVMEAVCEEADADQSHILGIGITNQRETVVVWDRHTGKPLYRAIVWQDRRTAEWCRELREAGEEDFFRTRTGLRIDPYFSGTKLVWLLNHIDGLRDKANAEDLCFGTVDTWLIWNLTQGRSFVTDVTNASRTLLFNIHEQRWDPEILDKLDIPPSVLPEVCSCSEIIGDVIGTGEKLDGIPISGVAGDQHAALFGQTCFKKGMVKSTYGTGCFVLMNTGSHAVLSDNQLLTTIAWKVGSDLTYAMEGSVFIGGAVVQWLRDELNIIETAQECDQLAAEVKDNHGVAIVPAFAGLGAPYWDPFARGMIVGLTRGANKRHICLAALESIALQVTDQVQCMERDTGLKLQGLRVDGGATNSDLLLQIQSDLIQDEVTLPECRETTALGAAFLAGLAVGFWDSQEEIEGLWREDRRVQPRKTAQEVARLLDLWKKAVQRSRDWLY